MLPIYSIYMGLTFREGYWLKLCMKLIEMIGMMFYDNYFSHFYRPFVNSCSKILLPLIRQFFLIPNIIKEFVDRRQYVSPPA
jgi:hypothetical protein